MTQIGLGLAALGRPEYINIRESNPMDKSEKAFKKNTFSVLDEAYKLGIRYFDTAPSYGKGEAFLQEWHATRNYNDVILGTKWGYTYVANWQLGYNGKHEIKEHSIEKLLEQWRVSKKMLPKLTYYQVHSATFESGILKNQDVLNELLNIKKDTGLKIGITTSGPNQKEVIESALNIQMQGKTLFDSFQVTYNIFEQSAYSILNKLITAKKTVIVKEALANGRIFKNKLFPQYQESYKILNGLSTKYNVGTDAIALRFVIDNLQPTFLLSGASNSMQLQQNLSAFSFNLTEEELNLLKTLQVSSETYWSERNTLAWN
ncbi:oxidoreductase [Pseudalgibacter alginicilyticus]|uniref:Oxidoreductase n=1 Tax=Pseudalgibacter alginicilyticus TaxID=1736674 RepID=A0A0P0D2W5_9FLAO|nr:aldo/keto reductase [Pseudalgibacter alginicilyticus]ALJ05256.1 oxidoreductase [Pseudalgibacter alginicilyticus]